MKTEKKYSLNGDLNDIQNVLIDIEYYGKLHPLIRSTKKIENTSKEYQAFKIKERPYPFIPISIEYSVRVKSMENVVEYEITGLPFTKVCIIKYHLFQVGIKQTKVLFNLQLETLPIFEKRLLNKMVAAQNQLMEAINKR